MYNPCFHACSFHHASRIESGLSRGRYFVNYDLAMKYHWHQSRCFLCAHSIAVQAVTHAPLKLFLLPAKRWQNRLRRNVNGLFNMTLFRFAFIGLLFSLVSCASAPPTGKATGSAGKLCEEPRPQICTMDYRPVCGTLNDASVKTYANGCGACGDANVVSWVEGECPE